jgi:uncharacterized protein YjiS (DUF1127 family)
MSTTYGSAQMRRTATSLQQIITLFVRFRNAWQKRRGRQRIQAALHALSDRELMDVGATRGEIDHIAAQRSIARPPRSTYPHSGDALRRETVDDHTS